METEGVIEVESLENSNNEFPIYKTKDGRRFLGWYKNITDNSVVGFGIPDANGVTCSESLLEETGEFGSKSMELELTDKYFNGPIIREENRLREIYGR